MLSGTDVTLRYGEGLLDFIYADFESPARMVIDYLDMWESRDRTVTSSAEKVYDQTQEEILQRMREQVPITDELIGFGERYQADAEKLSLPPITI